MPYYPPTSDNTKLPLAGGTMTGGIVSTLGAIIVDTPALSATQTWNSGGVTFKGLFLNVTNTASAAASKLLDLQLGGSSKFNIGLDGVVSIVGPAITLASMPRLHFMFTSDNDPAMGYLMYAHDNLAITFDSYHNGTDWIASHTTALSLYKTGAELVVGWKSSATKGVSFPGFALTDAVRFSNNGSLGIGIAAGGYRLNVNGTARIVGPLEIGTGADTAFSRNAAGVLEVNNGTAGTFRDLKLRTLISEAGTITADTPALSATQTWNNAAVAFNGIKLNVTNTASAAASALMDLQVGGSSRFAVGKDGVVTISGPSSTLATMPRVHFKFDSDGDPALGFLMYSHDNLALSFDAYHGGGAAWMASHTDAFSLYKTSSELVVGWASGLTKGVAFGGGFQLTDSVRFSNNGSLGIGIAAGTARLNVQGTVRVSGANAQSLGIQTLTELTTIAAAATTDTTIQMPAGAIVLAVSVRVTTAIPTAATFTVGDSGVADRFNTGASVLVAAGTTNAGTKAGAYYNAGALAVRITPNLTPAAATRVVRVTIHYLQATPPTS